MKRFSPDFHRMIESPEGEWVRFSDVKSEIDRLESMNSNLSARLAGIGAMDYWKSKALELMKTPPVADAVEFDEEACESAAKEDAALWNNMSAPDREKHICSFETGARYMFDKLTGKAK